MHLLEELNQLVDGELKVEWHVWSTQYPLIEALASLNEPQAIYSG